MCFNFGIKLVHHCKVKSIQDAESARFDLNTGLGQAVVVRNDIDKNITLIFAKTIQDFGLYQYYDFNLFSIANGCTVEFGDILNLVAGDYPLIIDGDYIKYTIPYVE